MAPGRDGFADVASEALLGTFARMKKQPSSSEETDSISTSNLESWNAATAGDAPHLYEPEAGSNGDPGDEDWESASSPFIGRWNRLISVTNWEKGRIISQWRHAVQQAGAPAADSSDEAWSRRVGGVSPQHVGRLRRTYDRFGDCYKKFEGLYWSHFLSALEWDDAEMYLEGAIQNSWSVSQMRKARWKAMGGLESEEPQAADIVESEPEEEAAAREDVPPDARLLDSQLDDVSGVVREGADFGENGSGDASGKPDPFGTAVDDDSTSAPAMQPFNRLADMEPLPDDVADAMDQFKVVIVRHKSDGWKKVSREAFIACLAALREFVDAPA